MYLQKNLGGQLFYSVTGELDHLEDHIRLRCPDIAHNSSFSTVQRYIYVHAAVIRQKSLLSPITFSYSEISHFRKYLLGCNAQTASCIYLSAKLKIYKPPHPAEHTFSI